MICCRIFGLISNRINFLASSIPDSLCRTACRWLWKENGQKGEGIVRMSQRRRHGQYNVEQSVRSASNQGPQCIPGTGGRQAAGRAGERAGRTRMAGRMGYGGRQKSTNPYLQRLHRQHLARDLWSVQNYPSSHAQDLAGTLFSSRIQRNVPWMHQRGNPPDL